MDDMLSSHSPPDEPPNQYSRFNLPKLGFRNYWYPVLPAWRLLRKPKAVTVLGEDIVLFRDGGRVFALADRCPHRGAKFSIGKCQFAGSGTISCPYHGWTFKGDTGECVAAIMEGPESTIPGSVRVKPYPVEVRNNLIWLYVGDGPAPAFADDVPNTIADRDNFFTITSVVDYACNWRVLTDNWTNEHHGPYIHGNSPELIFQPLPPFNQTISVMDHGNDRSIGFPGKGGINHADFPGLGSYPRSTWHRFMKPTGRGVRANWETTEAAQKYGVLTPTSTRIPGLVTVARPSGLYFLVQFAMPIDEHRTRLFNINCFRRRGRKRELYDRLHYAVFRGWAHDWLFSGQDKKVVESVSYGPERLSRTDVGLVGWRKFAGTKGHKVPAQTR